MKFLVSCNIIRDKAQCTKYITACRKQLRYKIPIENISRGIDEPPNPLLSRSIGHCTIAGENWLLRFRFFLNLDCSEQTPKETQPLQQSERKRKSRGRKAKACKQRECKGVKTELQKQNKA